MLDEKSLIGKNLDIACKILQENGYNEIKLIDNFVSNEKCNEKLVCGVKLNGDAAKVYVGQFITGI